MPDYSKGRLGHKIRFYVDQLKISLYSMQNDKGWLFESWVKDNPICYERYWTECFFKGKQIKTCISAELCYNKYLNSINPSNQNTE